MNAIALRHGIAARAFPEIDLRIAALREEREAAFQLVYSAYHEAGLCEYSELGQRFTPYQLLPTTDIFLADYQGETVSTLSLVRDGELGLPMEDLYADQVEARRKAGLRLAEVSCLADRRRDPSRFFKLFCDLSRLMVQSAQHQQVDQLLIAVHPRHAALYKRYMSFEKIGNVRDYNAVNGNPAVPLCLDLNEVRMTQPRSWEEFFGQQIPRRFLRAAPITTSDREYFLGLLEDERRHQEQLDFDDFSDCYQGSECLEEALCA